MKYCKEMNYIAFPLIANSILGLLMGLVNQAMIGRISRDAFGAVGVVNALLFTIAGILGVISVTFHINGSRSIGQGDKRLFQEYFVSTLLLDILIGAALAIFFLLFQRPLLSILYQFEGNILEYTTQYLSIMSGYVLIQLLLFTFSSAFKIIKDTKWIFIGSTIASVMNVCLNYLLIFGNLGFPRLEVRGAAIATILSLSINLLIYIYLCREYLKISFVYLKRYMRHIILLLKESCPLAGQEVLEGSIFIIGIQGIIARIGNLELFGYLLVTQIVSIILIPMHMYASAILTLIIEKYALGQVSGLKIIPRIALGITMILFCVLSMMFIYFQHEVSSFLSSDKQLVYYAGSILLITILANFFNPMQSVYKAALQAIGKSDFVLLRTFIVNLLAFSIMLLLCFTLQWNFRGVLIGIFFNYVVLSIIFASQYRKMIGL